MTQVGDRLLCIDNYGWSPGCVTIGKIYSITSIVNGEDIFCIKGDTGYDMRTNMRCFKLLSEIRNEKLKEIGI